MTETPESANTHSSRSHSRKSSSRRHLYDGNPQPVYYFSGVIIMLIIVKLLHASILPPAIGAIGIIILSVSKNLKWTPGVFISSACILLMVMIFTWEWTDHYFLNALSGEFNIKPQVVSNGITESLILATLVWFYQRLLVNFHAGSGQKWSGKSFYMKFFKLLFYFLLFFLFFCIFNFIMAKVQPVISLGNQDSTMIAGAMALLAAGIPAIIYISRGSQNGKQRHHHRHHHRHTRNDELKNTNPG